MGESMNWVPAGGDFTRISISRSERAVGHGVPHAHPLVTHILEACGAGPLMVEIGDQFPENPSLVGVGDSAMAMVNDGLGEKAPPRQVLQLDGSQPPPVHVHRAVRRRSCDLVGDSQHRVEAMLARHVQIAVDLLSLQGRTPRLDLNQAAPAGLAALHHDRPVGDRELAVRIL